MSIHPSAEWSVPATTWAEVVKRYVEHRQVKTWRGRTHGPNGEELPDHWDPQKAARWQSGVQRRIEQWLSDGNLPPVPFPLGAQSFDGLLRAEGLEGRSAPRCPSWLGELRKAAVLNRDAYTCYYCRRTAWAVFQESGRTLRFEMDHGTARSRLVECNDFDMANIFAACRSCNVLKGQMEVEPFLEELHSLARAVVRNTSTR